MKKIKLDKDTYIDLDILIQSRAVILANSGGGKSHTIRWFAEQVVEHKQIIIIDPEGEFSSLREKYDFILCGKNADVPVETRSAALLAIKLLEMGKSAVIDLYELSKQDRQRFVKLFFNAMVDCPKELYHQVFVILDEAHDYAPEGKPSEATQAVEDLASKGRKRGQCLIPASQRISKLSKNVSAECNNKLIGRASQDLDMKRAGDELGFNKEKLVQLRQLKPGEFFTFGPAISDEVKRITVGAVNTAHNKVGYKDVGKVPPASDAIKKVLSALKDLPQEAKKEAQTIEELKTELRTLRAHRWPKVNLSEDIEKAVKVAVHQENRKFDTERQQMIAQTRNFLKIIEQIGKIIGPILKDPNKQEITRVPSRDEISANMLKNGFKTQYVGTDFAKKGGDKSIKVISRQDKGVTTIESVEEVKPINGGTLRILKVLTSRYPMEFTKSQLATFSKLSPSSGTYSTYLSLLRGQNMIELNGDLLKASQAGLDYVGESPNVPQTTEEVISMWKENLQGGARRIFEVIVERYPNAVTKEEISENVGIVHTSGTFSTYLSMLRSNGLITIVNGEVRLSENLII